MAIYKLFPSQDASIYSAFPAMNTGLDPILDIANSVTEFNPVAQVARSIVQFDQSEVENVIDTIAKVTGSEFNNWSSSLKLNIAKANNVIINSYVEAWPISGSWNNGTGQYLDNKQGTNGVSWEYSDYSGSYQWPTAGFVPLTTGSYSGSNNAGGAVWYTGSGTYTNVNNANMGVSQSYNLRSTKDLDMNVTDIVKVWYSSSKDINAGQIDIANNGFLLKWADAQEFVTSSAVSPQLSYYSVDTNTIYPPELEIKWRDFTYSTSSGDFKLQRTLTGSNYSTALVTNISCSFTQSLPAPISNTGTGTGATFGATFNEPNMINVFVKDIGSGYKAGDQLTWSTAQIDALPGITSGGTDSVVTISTFDIQQLNVIATPDLYVALDNNAGVFYSESINDFRLNVRPEFPVRTFQTSSLYTTNFALPSASYYAIKDLDTNEFVIDFDKEFTQISCDPTSSYFTVYMNGLEPERYYNILIQTEIDGQTIVMDENYYFKVVNG